MEDREEPKDASATSPSKRALLKAAWVAPVILSVALPRVVMAQASGIPAPPPATPP
jgi:hypothetical protein